MKAEVTRFIQQKTFCVSYVNASSLLSALREDAVILAQQLTLSGGRFSRYCPCKHTNGPVDAHITKLEQGLVVTFYNKHGDHFATVKVTP